MPTGIMVTDSTVGTATGATAEVDFTINMEVFSTCTPGTLVLPDAKLCQKFFREICGCTRNAGKGCSGLSITTSNSELRPAFSPMISLISHSWD